ncbi:hypothetical protein BDN70DRAFT_900644 [Pholiota conissans]|uniref:Nephrocystin 3-like N-terminal domain-containing protein n=1 Tax=Pholiota conissans TaxID=109636 RepID=A0A9P6CU73_9AGAR|nr:hypothetical protein BDN70DRAFT_900644 [Pholiota conissans]
MSSNVVLAVKLGSREILYALNGLQFTRGDDESTEVSTRRCYRTTPAFHVPNALEIPKCLALPHHCQVQVLRLAAKYLASLLVNARKSSEWNPSALEETSPWHDHLIVNVERRDSVAIALEARVLTRDLWRMMDPSEAEVMQSGICPNRRGGLEILTEQVARAAFHNSAQRIDPPRCHPKTREDVLETMFEWIMSSKQREEWILWLNGAAGAGKSAIMQTLAERCVAALMAVASFFFFRTDSTRNSIGPLVATLAYQLIQTIPEVSDHIQHIIENNPLIFDQTIESQLQQLIVQPYLHLPAHLRRPFVVFIDGLDECVDHIEQATFIKVFGDIAQKRDVPIVFVIASRRERQIEAAFGKEHVTGVLRTIPLDELSLAQTSSEIHLYLTDKFEEIKKTHPRRQDLPLNWPQESSIESIVDKSSGQFIYASVVVNFVSTPHTLPSTQLSIIKNIRPRGATDRPFANLDALYKYIFSKVEQLDVVKSILVMMLTTWFSTPSMTIKEIEALFSLQAGDLESLLANLAAVIHCIPYTTTEVKFLHASLGDFLLDQSRSEEYYIDLEEHRLQLLCIFFESHIPDALYYRNVEGWRIGAIVQLLTYAKATAPLQCSILKFKFGDISIDIVAYYDNFSILNSLQNLDFGDHGQAYHHVLNIFATCFAKRELATIYHYYSHKFPEELVTRMKKINPAFEVPKGWQKGKHERAISRFRRLKREAKYLLDYLH